MDCNAAESARSLCGVETAAAASSSSSSWAQHTPSPFDRAVVLHSALETARDSSGERTAASRDSSSQVSSPSSLLESAEAKKTSSRSRKHKKAKLSPPEAMCSLSTPTDDVFSSSKEASPAAQSSSTSYRSPQLGADRSGGAVESPSCSSAASSSASKSPMSTSSGDRAGEEEDVMSQQSSVCTSATTPNNAKTYVHRAVKKAHRDTKHGDHGRGSSEKKHKRDKHKHSLKEDSSSSMGLSSVSADVTSGGKKMRTTSDLHDRSALCAILGSVHTPRPQLQL